MGKKNITGSTFFVSVCGLFFGFSVFFFGFLWIPWISHPLDTLDVMRHPNFPSQLSLSDLRWCFLDPLYLASHPALAFDILTYVWMFTTVFSSFSFAFVLVSCPLCPLSFLFVCLSHLLLFLFCFLETRSSLQSFHSLLPCIFFSHLFCKHSPLPATTKML